LPRAAVVDYEATLGFGRGVEAATGRVIELAKKAEHERGNIRAPLAERRNVDVKHVQSIVEVGAELPRATASRRSLLVAAITRTLAFTGRVLPRRTNSTDRSEGADTQHDGQHDQAGGSPEWKCGFCPWRSFAK
jgi:hypothetical protein